MLALGHEVVCFVSLGPVALVLSLRVFFVKNLLSSWYLGVGVALALTLARLLLRDFGPLVPRPLLPGLWWRCWSWDARSCSPGHIIASVLVPGPWTWLPRLSPAIRLPPMGWLGWGGLCMSPLFEMLSVLFPGNIGSHFLGISRSVFGSV